MKALRVCVVLQGLLASALAARPPSTELRRLLARQGFEAPLNNKSDIEQIGAIRGGNETYQIYYYRYVFPLNKRGIGRLIVIRNAKTYVGSYDVTTTNSCRTLRLAVICDTWSGYDKVIRFTNAGPPRVAYIDGRLVEIDYGNATRKLR